MEAPQLAPTEEVDSPPHLQLVEDADGLELNDWFAGPESFRVQVLREDNGTLKGPSEVRSTHDHYWKLNGNYKGVVDWALVDDEGVVDHADSVPDTLQFQGSEVKIRRAAWRLIAICMHHINKDIPVIDTPAGKIVFH